MWVLVLLACCCAGITDMYGPFYSAATATGLIMATGSVGGYLQQNKDINTYLSRDAGKTWAEVRKVCAPMLSVSKLTGDEPTRVQISMSSVTTAA